MVSTSGEPPPIKTEIERSLNIKKIKTTKISSKHTTEIALKLFFEKDDNGNITTDASLYQDILRFYFEIAKESIGSDTFKVRELQRWLILNNKEFKNHYSDSRGKTTIENRIKNRKDRIKKIFDNLIILNLIGKKGKAPHGKICFF